ncbi:MAG: family 10 glycosylhydrolase [Bacteroidales bacterium]
MIRRLSLIFIIILKFSVSIFYSQTAPEKEFRGVWVATAFNLDWPSSALLSSEEQKQEFINLLEAHRQNGINAVLVQIRPAAEVFYESKFEPWSHWLTGEQGKAPDPYYDPLLFMVDECHKRNMEFHAWFNPFRCVSNIARVKTVPDHISKIHPEWCVKYGSEVEKLYFNPGIPEVRAYIIEVVMEVAHKYNIDGVHFDDYFYPAKEAGVEFPDNNAFLLYNDKGLNKADWRRENLNDFIHTLSDSINSLGKGIKFGVGPSGIWRNKSHDPDGSDTRGLASYDEQFADVVKWLREGWIDYVSPQIYWPIGYKAADYEKLVEWWSRHVYGKHLYIGQATQFINKTNAWKNPSEIPDQLRLSRLYPEVKGNIFYSSSTLLRNNNGILDSLKRDFYISYVDVPDMSWKPKIKNLVADTSKVIKVITLPEPMAPINLTVTKVGRETLISWSMDESQKIFVADTGSYYHVYRFKGIYAGYPGEANLYKTTRKPFIMVSRRGLFKKKYSFIITAVNRQNRESWPSEHLIIKMKE